MAVDEKQANICLTCLTSGISQTCRRYKRRLKDNNAQIAALVEAPDGQTAQETRPSGCAFCIRAVCGALAGTKSACIAFAVSRDSVLRIKPCHRLKWIESYEMVVLERLNQMC